MQESLTDFQPALLEAERIKADLDKKVFYLQTLLETSRELAGLVQPKKILDTFLLMTMGPLGIVQGMGALINSATGQGHLTGRGISDPALEEVSKNLSLIFEKYFAKEPSSSVAPRVKVITRENFADQGFCPAQMQIVILYDLPGEFSGFFGLGQRISGEPFGDDDINILLNLTNILTNALSQALFFRNTERLNADLVKKNEELQFSLSQAREAREELDKRVFHLSTLSALNEELRTIIDEEELLHKFLLTAMGSLGIQQGFALVYDREEGVGRTAARGITLDRQLDSKTCECLLYSSFEALQHKSVTPMSIGRITAPGVFRDAGLEIHAECGFFFVIDQTFMGVVALGQPLSGISFSEEEIELLSTQVSSLMAYLNNSRAFGTIRALNEDLTQRNEELRQTISDLVEARQKISILEKARAHIKAAIQNQAERINKPTSLDFALIFFISVAVGVLFNLASPQGIALLPESVVQSTFDSVKAGEALKLIEEKNAVLVDARPKEFYTQKHIKGAVNVPLSLFDVIYMMKLSKVDLETPIIVYGRSISRLYDVEVALRLKKRDHENVRVLSGDMESWEDQGIEVEP